MEDDFTCKKRFLSLETVGFGVAQPRGGRTTTTAKGTPKWLFFFLKKK
jgi:hypothetical protein